jgi:pyrroline-5-carboxylate reductase
MPSLGLAGNGQLGGAIGRTLLRTGFVDPNELWIFNRSGSRKGFEAAEGVRWTTELQALADHCDVILLALPPAAASVVGFRGAGRLVISVMAGIGCDRLTEISGTSRVVRAMSNPAAEISLAYSPWYAAAAVDGDDRAVVRALFSACGATDEVPSEDQIDVFTAITGPVPGFVAFFADSMVRYAEMRGVAPGIAERAVKQLFMAAGEMMASSPQSAAAHVKAMIDYAGTTAAGLLDLQASGIAAAIARGLDAARLRATTIGAPFADRNGEAGEG